MFLNNHSDINVHVRQNNVEELYSLVKFLRVKPLNDWQTFNEQINKPIKSGRSVLALKRLHVSVPLCRKLSSHSGVPSKVVLRAIMLRRRKTDALNGKPLIELPERHLSIVPCEFDKDEREFYFALENKIDEAMQKFVKNDEVMKNYTNVMVLLLRLRQGISQCVPLFLALTNVASLQPPVPRLEGLQYRP